MRFVKFLMVNVKLLNVFIFWVEDEEDVKVKSCDWLNELLILIVVMILILVVVSDEMVMEKLLLDFFVKRMRRICFFFLVLLMNSDVLYFWRVILVL